MNKHEAIKKVEQMGEYERFVNESIPKLSVLNILNQLDEPEKVTIPQFVADWYEEHKDDFEFNVWDWIAFRDELEKLENKEFTSWINDCEGNPIQILVNMHQFGYEVEKEPKYTVMVKGITGYGRYLNKISKKYCFASENEAYGYTTKHTRKELEEAGFGWIFSCEGIEVEEVE